MNVDPFKAPTAQVADRDTEPERNQPPRPASITLACRLLWATIALGLLSLIPGVRHGLWDDYANSPVAVLLVLAVIAFMTGIEIWLIRLVARRHGWARWALLIYLLAGWLMTFSDFSGSIEQGMAAVLVDLLTGLAEMAAVGLLFLSSGRSWFGRRGDAR
jgi:hypothetical protein